MKKGFSSIMFAALSLVAILVVLSGCQSKETDKKESEDKTETVTIEDIHGEVTVPKAPKKVVALDNRIEDWDIDLVAAPKDVMPAALSYVKDDKVENIGNHREPNLEVIAAAEQLLCIDLNEIQQTTTQLVNDFDCCVLFHNKNINE